MSGKCWSIFRDLKNNIICHPIVLIPDTTLSAQDDLNFVLDNHRKSNLLIYEVGLEFYVLAKELNLFTCYGKNILIFQMDALQIMSDGSKTSDYPSIFIYSDFVFKQIFVCEWVTNVR